MICRWTLRSFPDGGSVSFSPRIWSKCFIKVFFLFDFCSTGLFTVFVFFGLNAVWPQTMTRSRRDRTRRPLWRSTNMLRVNSKVFTVLRAVWWTGRWARARSSLLLTWKIPLCLNLPPCEAFLPSWLRFSSFSLTSINTLVTFQVFQLSVSLTHCFSSADSTTCILLLFVQKKKLRERNEDLLTGVKSWDAWPTRAPCFSKASRSWRQGVIDR